MFAGRLRHGSWWRYFLTPQGRFVLSVLVPLLVFYIGWLVYPLFQTILGSLREWRPLIKVPQPYVGGKNYLEAFADPIFRTTLRNTLYFAVVSVPLRTVVALALALLLQASGRAAGFFRTAYFAPVFTSMVACAIMWRWVYQAQYGLLNTILRQIGDATHLSLPRSTGWLSDKRLAMDAVILMSIWKDCGYAMIVYTAGLQGIPATYYDAAKVDGASRWQILRHVSAPLLQPTTMFVVITGVIGALQAFVQFFVMTGGGPGNSTRVVVLYLYEKAFDSYRFGYASAMSVILFAIILALTLLQLRVLAARWEY